MNSVSFDFADLSIGGSSPVPARPSREDGPAGFGDALHNALSQTGESKDEHHIDSRRGGSGSDEEAAKDADEDKNRDDSSSLVVTVIGAVDQVRTMPEPTPEGGEGAIDLDPALDAGRSFEALKAMLLTILRGGDASRQAPGAGPAIEGQLDAQNPAELAGELANKLIEILRGLVGGNQADETGADVPEAGVGGDAWRQTLMEKLSEMVEPGLARRSQTPAGTQTTPSPMAQNLTKFLSNLANDDSNELRSLTHALNSSSVLEMLNPEKTTGLDRHIQTFLNHLQLDSSAATLPPVEIEAPGAMVAPVDVDAIDADLREQIVQSIRVHALDLGGEARVRLRPAYLGEVVVSVKVDAGAVTATLQADTAAVRRWMETHETSLRHGLADHGLRLDRLIVSEPSKSEHEPAERRRQQSQQQPDRQHARGAARDDEEAPTFEVVA